MKYRPFLQGMLPSFLVGMLSYAHFFFFYRVLGDKEVY